MPTIDIIKKLDNNKYFWCNEAFLINVENGKGALREVVTAQADASNDYIYSSLLLLNNKPLVQCRLPACPTCAGLLATGYGIENTDCDDLKEISNKINSEYKDLETAIEILKPLLLLLESGLYVIADIKQYPTDGNGNFFWAVNNSFTLNPATASAYTKEYTYVGSIPVFLYPSQSTDYFNKERVNHYIELFSHSKNSARTISYNLKEFICILLDGHHKAAAAALLGKAVSSITIIPFSCYSYKANIIDSVYFSPFCVDAKYIPSDILNKLNNRYKSRKPIISIKQFDSNVVSIEWDKKYIVSAKKYPTVDELADILALGTDEISDDFINSCFVNLTEKDIINLRYIVAFLSRTEDIRTKKLALKCAGAVYDFPLKKAAFRALSKIKNDPDIEQFFIEHLIDDHDKYSILRKIAESYWD